MARGVRKSTLEKLQMELEEVTQSIQQYESCLSTLRERAVQLQEQIQLEEGKAIADLLRKRGLNAQDLIAMLEDNTARIMRSA